jgi:hypothetical protein
MGCWINIDVEDAHAFALVEEWRSQEALNRHRASPAYETLVAAIELSEQPPTIRFDHVDQRARLEGMEAARRACGKKDAGVDAKSADGPISV